MLVAGKLGGFTHLTLGSSCHGDLPGTIAPHTPLVACYKMLTPGLKNIRTEVGCVDPSKVKDPL